MLIAKGYSMTRFLKGCYARAQVENNKLQGILEALERIERKRNERAKPKETKKRKTNANKKAKIRDRHGV